MTRRNIITNILNLLDIKYTKEYANRYFSEHPYKYTMYGISSILNHYGIQNSGLKISKKEDIKLLELPLIAHIKNDFVVVEKISDNIITFLQDDDKHTMLENEFYDIWTGYTLLVEKDSSSREPSYSLHYKEQLFNKFQLVLPIAIMILLIGYSIYTKNIYKDIGIMLLLIINVMGTFVGCLLVSQKLFSQGNYVEKICSLFHQSDCNSILNSEASKLFGFLGLSEIGLGYFIANVFILSFATSFVDSIAIINVLSLPLTFWSVWYQLYKAKSWCPLCLVTMTLLWLIFFVDVFFSTFHKYDFHFSELYIVGGIYLIIILGLNTTIRIVANSRMADNIKYEINSIKTDQDVFNVLLSKRPHFEVEKTTSQLLFGNKNADNIITIFSNPHCNPCGIMHKKAFELVRENKNICLQYILSSFSKDLDVSCKYLIGVYQQKGETAVAIFSSWFDHGKNNKEVFFSEYPIEIDESVIKEYTKHEEWKKKSALRSTPTILFNGYLLPDNYKIEDLKFFV